MKILALADIDASRWKWQAGSADVVVSCGDVFPEVILQAAEACRCAAIFAVKGNHDSAAPFPDPIIDLHLRAEEHRSVLFGGLNGSWKYKPKGHFLYDQFEVQRFLSPFGRVDVFVSHNSPRGVHDKDDQVHYGFEALNGYITSARPSLLIHGHQHVNRETKVEGTRVVGVCGHRVIDTAPGELKSPE